jgi:hypothetical protein
MSTLEDQNIGDNLPDELTMLKQRASMMGIQFSNNIGLETLRKKIEDKMEGRADSDAAPQINPLAGETTAQPLKRKTLRQKLYDEQMKLVRIRVTNLDPKKKDLPGEVITVANEHLGTVRKFVPFGEVTDDGYHVPYCIYRFMEKRKFLNIRIVKDRRTGVERVESNWVKEFALEVLPQLTPQQIANLRTAQIAAGSVD